MLPKHDNPTQPDRVSKAPYNFVPLPDEVIPAVAKPEDLPDHDTFTEDTDYRHTGFFEVKLTTKSPLYVRGGLSGFKEDKDTPSEYERAEQQRAHPPRDFREALRNKPDFFNRGSADQPVIPGSSLRGMLRQLVEIIAYSKVKDVTSKKLVYRAVGDQTALGDHYREQMMGQNKSARPRQELHFDYSSVRVKGGYLEKDGDDWFIRPAVEWSGESIVRVWYEQADPFVDPERQWTIYDVFIRPASRGTHDGGIRDNKHLTLDVAITDQIDDSPGVGLKPAKLMATGHMGGDHAKHWHCAIYEPDMSKSPIPIPDEMWGTYKEDRDMTRDKNRATLKIERADYPLFYLVDSKGQLVYFGSTAMFRLVYDRRPIDLIPPQLRSPEIIDFAEALFGFVRDDDELKQMNPQPKQGEKGRAYAGRVFVTDATLDAGQQNIWLPVDAPDGVLEPAILASPKPTSFQHYLTQSNPNEKAKLNFYDSRETTLRGFKMYWAKGNVSAETLRAQPSPDDLARRPDLVARRFERQNGQWRVKADSKQHTRMKPVNVGKSFTFRVYFEHLSSVELGALEWALRLPGPAVEYCHRLGMGKALGMGAVKLEKPTLHLVKPTKRYSQLLDEHGAWQLGSEPDDSARSYMKEYESHVFGRLPDKGNARKLIEVERIQMLLKMLEWNDVDRDADKKQYETDLKRFRERRVLPDPLHLTTVVARDTQRGSYPPPRGGSQRYEERDQPRREVPRQVQPPKKKEPDLRESTDRTRSLAEEIEEMMKKRAEEQAKKKPK